MLLFQIMDFNLPQNLSANLPKCIDLHILQVHFGILKKVERELRTAKTILKKNQDPYLALLLYNSTPLQNNMSPSQLLMGQRLKIRLPVDPVTLKPKDLTSKLATVASKEDSCRKAHKNTFNQMDKPRELSTFEPEDEV